MGAGEGLCEDRLPQGLRTFQVGIDLGFEFADDGEAAVDFGDDALLLLEWRQWNWK